MSSASNVSSRALAAARAVLAKAADRLYDEADLLRLLQIQNLKALGLSLPEIAGALADASLDAAATLRSHLSHLEDRIAAEQVLARRLAGHRHRPGRGLEGPAQLPLAQTRQRLGAHPPRRAEATQPGRQPESASWLANYRPGICWIA